MAENRTVSVRIDAARQEQLDQIAASLDRSRNWLINQAIDQYVDLYAWQREQIEQALAEAEGAPSDKFQTSEEVDNLITHYRQ